MLFLSDSEYMSGTRTKIHDFDCKVKGEAVSYTHLDVYKRQEPYYISYGSVRAIAYCVQPAKPGPGSGNYTITKIGDNQIGRAHV